MSNPEPTRTLSRATQPAAPETAAPAPTLELAGPVFDSLVAWGAALWRAGAHREALPFLRICERARPNDLQLLKVLASTYQKLGLMRQAAPLYQRALHMDPHQTDVLTNLAEIRIAQLRYSEALELIGTCINLDPHYRDGAAQRARALVMQVVDNLGSP